jgi:hypothetical protein
MNYVEKEFDGYLLVLPLINENCNFIKLTGDYVGIWHLLKSDTNNISNSPNIDQFKSLAAFITLLHINNLLKPLTDEIEDSLNHFKHIKIVGSFTSVEAPIIEEDSLAGVYAPVIDSGASNGTSPYGGVEPCPSPLQTAEICE